MSNRRSLSMASAPDEAPSELPGAFPTTQSEEDEVPQVASDLNSLSRAVYARRSEYIRKKTVTIRIGTWNVAALPGTEVDLKKWFNTPTENAKSSATAALRETMSAEFGTVGSNPGSDSTRNPVGTEEPPTSASEGTKGNETPTGGAKAIDIFVLGLQEIVDLTSPAETLRPYVDPEPSNRWKQATKDALPPGYVLVSSQQLIGLLLLIYASEELAPSISSISSTSVGTGLMGYMGNKGAVATRMVLGGATRIVFVNCHLAAGADQASLERRNWDATQVLLRTRFEPLEGEDAIDQEAGRTLGEEDFAFWFGDLNYRLDSIPGNDVRRLLHLHTENDFGPLPKGNQIGEDTNSHDSTDRSVGQRSLSEDSEGPISMIENDFDQYPDPASLETTLVSLLPHDQLHLQQKKRKAFHEGWVEAPIKFLPTYKYDVGRVGKFDSSEKQRSPSWCDRILYRTKQDFSKYQKWLKESEDAKRRDDEMKSLGLDQEEEDTNVLFNYDPEVDGAADYDENEDANEHLSLDILEEENSECLIKTLAYSSHQDVVSSDHKPLHADYVISHDAVIHDLKMKVHQEVARDLDKAENEARPDITVVVDQSTEDPRNNMTVSTAPADRDTVDFGLVRYDVPVSRSLTLANTSSVPATFSFQYRPLASDDDVRVSPPWLHIRVGWPVDDDTQPSIRNEYTLPPGDSAHVQLLLCVFDLNFVRELNTGALTIEDVLVLRISNGRDHFISVRGQWLLSCFSLTLEELTRLPEGGVRALDVTSFSAKSSEDNQNKSVRTSAPREIFRLTEAIIELVERSLAEWGMIGDADDSGNDGRPWASSKPGWPFDPDTWSLTNNRERYKLLGWIREGLDTGTSFFSHVAPEVHAKHRAELLAETLLSFLRSLHDGLITPALWSELEKQVFGYEKIDTNLFSGSQAESRVLEVLSASPAHSVSFTFLTFMLNRVANEVAPLSYSPPVPISPTTPTTPSTTTSRVSTEVFEPMSPTAPSAPSSARSSITFPFRLRARSRTQTSSDSSDPPMHPLRPLNNVKNNTQNGSLARRRAVNKSFAKSFADVIFSKSIALPEKDKEKRAMEDRKRATIELFLTEGES